MSNYVTYFIAQPPKNGKRMERNNATEKIAEQQQQAVSEFISNKENASVLATVVEIPKGKYIQWTQLQQAIDICKSRDATLVIAELGTLTNNEAFSQLLLSSGIKFHCCDQPFVDSMILEALSKHAQVQKKLHGQLIREGLKMTSAKSGNPNAAEVISKVNKPKIDVAVLFAFLLKYITDTYKRKGYSQRQMVKTLNDEGFTAPEGGKWVLSQLQKVLDRVRLNEVAVELTPSIDQLRNNKYTEQQIAEELNTKGISSLRRTIWDEAQVNKLLARIDQIRDIEFINKFVLDLLPLLHAYQARGLNAIDILAELDKAGLTIRQKQAEAVA